MFKKFLAMSVVVGLLVAFAGCMNNNDNKGTETSTTTVTEAKTEEPTTQVVTTTTEVSTTLSYADFYESLNPSSSNATFTKESGQWIYSTADEAIVTFEMGKIRDVRILVSEDPDQGHALNGRIRILSDTEILIKKGEVISVYFEGRLTPFSLVDESLKDVSF